MAYSPEQLALARTIVEVGRRRGAPRKRIKAALETALVEANLSNPRGGHGTSAGWRQEIDTYGSVERRTNVRGAARRFYSEAASADRPGLSSGALAQAVQKSAYPGRYAQRGREAGKLLRNLSKGAQRAPERPQTPSGDLSGDDGRRQALIDSLISPRSRGRPLTEAQGRLASGRYNLDQVVKERTTRPRASAHQRPSGGRVQTRPGADRPGVSTKPEVRQFVRQISGLLGAPLTIGTGTNHSRLTVNGNVSNHWDGNAADVPLRGEALIRAGQAALIAAGMPERRARRVRGGLINYRGWQIIFNTHEGGDHTDHLHVGRRG